MITVGIKPGTAGRLGLRKPLGPLLGIIRVPAVSEEQFEELRAKFEATMESSQGRWQVLPYPADRSWLEVTRSRWERRRRLGLRWWQRGER